MQTKILPQRVQTFVLQQIRYAGGGARPGGRPTFNWKQRRILGLDIPEKQKTVPLNLTGPSSHLIGDLNLKYGDELIDLKKVKYDSAEMSKFKGTLQQLVDYRPILKISSLFGSAKSYGFIQKKFKSKKMNEKKV